MWAQTSVMLSGRVTDAATGRPVENAIVTVTSGAGSITQIAHSDAGGSYSFEEIAPGSAQVQVSAEGFIAFQRTNPDDVSIRIAADHAEHNFKLTPVASIAGRISGDGTAGLDKNVLVTLFREDFTDGVRHFAGGTTMGPVNSFGTGIGPDGSFKLTALEPGRYLVSAGPRSNSSTGARALLEPHLPAEEYVQTYYPGTTEFADAVPVSLGAGETRTVDFRLTKRPLFRASGEVKAPLVEPWEGTVQVDAAGDGLVRRAYSGKASVPGPFVVEGLPPGQYTVTAITGAPQIVSRSVTGGSFSMSMRTMPVNLSFAITDHDVGGLSIVPEPPRQQMEVNGFFRMANAGDALPAGLSVQYAYPAPGGESTPVPAAPTGEFWLNGVPGDYSVQPVVPSGYAVTEVRYGGANYLNSLFPISGNSPDSSLTIVLTNHPGTVAGSIMDAEQKPVAARIVLVPDPIPAGFDFRAIRAVSSDKNGAFALNGLTPGRYKAIALTGDDRKQDHDLALIGPRLVTADAFEVAAGQSVTINVKP